jgi:hypothetical protein
MDRLEGEPNDGARVVAGGWLFVDECILSFERELLAPWMDSLFI